MNIIKRNIDEMHILFGVKTHTKCEKCVFLLNENHCFCEKWGKNTKWSKKFKACGLYKEREDDKN